MVVKIFRHETFFYSPLLVSELITFVEKKNIKTNYCTTRQSTGFIVFSIVRDVTRA